MTQFVNLGDIYQDLHKRLGKDVTGAYISPNDFMLALNTIQIELINRYAQNYESSTEVTADTYPFVKTYGDDEYPELVLNEHGKTDFPKDFLYISRSNNNRYINVGCKSETGYASIDLLSQMDFDGRMNTPMLNPIKNPRENGAIAVIQNGKIRVVPNVKRITLTGLRFPSNIVFDWEEINGQVVFLPVGSAHINGTTATVGSASSTVELEWPRQVWPEIVNMLVRYFAVNERSEFNLQTLNKDKV
jgi:hypothetical protein